MTSESKCPVAGGGMHTRSNRDWWPTQSDISVLHQNSDLSDPMDANFDYVKEFQTSSSTT